MMTVWITKYALTSGVFTCDAEIDAEFPGVISVANSQSYDHYHKPDWHDNSEDAVNQIETMIQRKIKSIQQSMTNIKNMQDRMRSQGISVFMKE